MLCTLTQQTWLRIRVAYLAEAFLRVVSNAAKYSDGLARDVGAFVYMR